MNISTHRRDWTDRRSRLVVCLAAIAIVVSAAAPANAARPVGLSAEVQRALDGVVAAGSPGAIALIRVGGHTFRLSSGNSNLGPLRPMRADLRTRIGSVTKSFTARSW
jgi:D-alanyl-D-alanine carboxypeptidase